MRGTEIVIWEAEFFYYYFYTNHNYFSTSAIRFLRVNFFFKHQLLLLVMTCQTESPSNACRRNDVAFALDGDYDLVNVVS